MWPAFLSAASSVVGSTMGGTDMVPNVFTGGDVSQSGGAWTVATGSAKASAVGSPAAAMAEWLTPAVIVAGLVLVVAVWRRR